MRIMVCSLFMYFIWLTVSDIFYFVPLRQGRRNNDIMGTEQTGTWLAHGQFVVWQDPQLSSWLPPGCTGAWVYSSPGAGLYIFLFWASWDSYIVSIKNRVMQWIQQLPFTSVKTVRECCKFLPDQASKKAEVTGILLQSINTERVADVRTKLHCSGI